MKIREWILNSLKEYAVYRLDKLTDIGAPKIIIEGQSKYLAELEQGILKVSGDVELLDEDYKFNERRKGRGGVVYYIINGNINFFPNAKYGMYITEREVKV